MRSRLIDSSADSARGSASATARADALTPGQPAQSASVAASWPGEVRPSRSAESAATTASSAPNSRPRSTTVRAGEVQRIRPSPDDVARVQRRAMPVHARHRTRGARAGRWRRPTSES